MVIKRYLEPYFHKKIRDKNNYLNILCCSVIVPDFLFLKVIFISFSLLYLHSPLVKMVH